MSTPTLKRLKEKIRELTDRLITAEGEDVERLTKELQAALHEHIEETRRVMLSQEQSSGRDDGVQG